MRAKLLSVLTVLIASAAVAYCCGNYGSSIPAQIKLTDQLRSGVIRGNTLIGVSAKGHLFRVHLPTGTVRDLGQVDAKLAKVLDVRDNMICLAGQERVVEIDAGSGKIVREAAANFTSAVTRIGFAGKDRVWVQHGLHVAVVDLASGQTVDVELLRPQQPGRFDAAYASTVAGSRYFAAVAADRSELTIVDLEQSKVLEKIPTPQLKTTDGYRGGDICVVGDRAYFLSLRFGYGVWTHAFGYIDLATRKYQALPLPSTLMPGGQLLAGPEGSVILANWHNAHVYSATSNQPRQVLNEIRGQFLAIWNGHAVVAEGEVLNIRPLTETPAQAVSQTK